MADAEGDSAASYLQSAFDFVTEVVLEGLVEDAAPDRFRLLVQPSPDYGATIIPNSDRFEIVVNDCVVSEMMRFCQAYADLSSPLLEDHISELGSLIGDPERVLGVSFQAGLAFLLLHEVGHVAGGHVRYLTRDTAEFRDRPADGSEGADGDFRRMAELEADGFAMALLFEFQDELVSSLGCPHQTSSEMHAVYGRALLLGVFAAISLLEGMFARERITDTTYPYPAIRLLNLCSAYLRVVQPDIARWHGDDYRKAAPDDATVQRISGHFRKSVAPALFLLHDALTGMGVASELHGVEDDPKTVQDFMTDALLLLGGGTPVHSIDGQALSDLTEKRPRFLCKLAPFRELDLWHAVGGETG
ncbi:hypothetical protein EU803_15610 [Loktanella sp. IMCC34160]|uniref:hypothetical protein n=1 Tax=Loktanella sp. IMCC34160 TaxID=2510646 RepID=UPI00101E0CA9|nr:hypothetical protein [Loktanella sp. IMCC34160]RYG90040.1 hypothetical protein EU803_15610 [Loktanella sp. IMCC34160]